MQKEVIILAIESSCDETACAVVRNGREIMSNIVLSQIDIHKLYGGVVPEIASRNHVEVIDAVYREALKEAGVTLDDVDAIAVTYGAGLVGALMVGVSFAKALSRACGKPLVAVNHIEGHICANYLTYPDLEPPYICLLTSGGNTSIVDVKDYNNYDVLASTVDDAVEVMEQEGLFYPDTLLIAYNGSLTWDCTAQAPLFSLPLPLDICRGIADAARRHGVHYQTYTDHEIVCEKEDEELRYYRRRIHLPVLLSPDPVSVLTMPPYKMHAIHLTDHERLEALKADVEERFSGRVTVQFSNDQYLEFFHSGSGKGSAILQLLRHLGIPVENSFSAGDAPNDISMLQAAGCGIAMKNADPEVKESADYITRFDNEHDGLADAVALLILNGG